MGLLQSRTSLLLEAAREGNVERVQTYADVDTIDARDQHGRTALMLTCVYGHSLATQVLLQRKASPDQTNHEGNTPLMKAASSGHVETVQVLIRAGASLEKPNLSRFTALMFAASEGHTAVCQLLVEARANVNAAADGYTSLMFAALNNHAGACRVLLDNGVDADARNDDNQTAFDIGKQKGFPRIVDILAKEMHEMDHTQSQE